MHGDRYHVAFCMRFFWKYPTSANIELTTRCNLRCSFCPHTTTRVEPRDLPWGTLEKFVEDLAGIPRLTDISPTGFGEPLLYPRFLDAIRLIKERYPRIPLKVTTNGTLLSRTISKGLAEVLTRKDSVLVSLNAWNPETYRAMMGADMFERVVGNIEGLIEERGSASSSFAIYPQFMRMIGNGPMADLFRLHWSSLLTGTPGGPYFRELENWGGKIPTSGLTTKAPVSRYACPSLWIVIMVDVDGNAYPCCEALSDRTDSSFILGNIGRQTLKEIYMGTRYEEIRGIHKVKRWFEFRECRECDFWSST